MNQTITTRRGWERQAQWVRDRHVLAARGLPVPTTVAEADDILRRILPGAGLGSLMGMSNLLHWANFGLQTVSMPSTYAAALMATDCAGAIREQPMPWPAFCVDVTTPLASHRGARMVCVLVAGQNGGTNWLSVGGVQIVVTAHFDDGEMAWGRFADLAELCRADVENVAADGSAAPSTDDMSRNDRMWMMVGRLVTGAVLTINQHRESKPGAYRAAPRTKRGVGRSNVWIVGRALKLDCRQSVADFVDGARRTLSTQHLRRGHWRNQAHGPNNALRRLQWIQPCWVGEGPTLVRPVVIGTEPQSEGPTK